MTNKIPPGVYSVENGLLLQHQNGYVLSNRAHNIATIGFSLPGVHQLEVRERSAEDVALKYGLCNCDIEYTSRILMAPDCPLHAFPVEEAMEEYRSQPIAPVSDEEIEAEFWEYIKEKELVPTELKIDLWKNSYKAALSRTQSGYTREQILDLIDKARSYNDGWNFTEDELLASLIPSITSVTIGEENNIIDIKYK